MSTIIIDTVVTTTNVLTTGTQGPVGPRGPAGDPVLIEQLQTQINALSSTKLDATDYVQHFRGLFTSYINLSTQVPTAIDGDYAHIKENETFGVMEAIWDSTDSNWVIIAVNVGSNTDAVAEGSTNLYFTSERVRQTTLNNVDVLNADQISPTDTIVQALIKLQSQLNNASGSIEWVNVETIGTLFSAIDAHNLQAAKIDGMLFFRGWFRNSSAAIQTSNPILDITDTSFHVLHDNVDAFQTISTSPLYWGITSGTVRITVVLSSGVQQINTAGVLNATNSHRKIGVGLWCAGILKNP
ncbi:hypothetical protein HMP0015_1215 [Acinetobacter haemolyticus ATCC 19194]|uniref:Uncharacterized protein n=2 Tax=Acinetobacter haemolyticus TaxID=29430 RepID=A0A857IHT3_ACIHA|nr:hypothetical protein [Acinetobacter haemolyticus]EFF83310.1 hypothetical protein HMP0015_1215 [Acinetobacter haemolyticus ATCC 19194]ENW21777.1 hypothetical protein F926_01070 [Acinetobacter haemolyticus NIPH 261]QHI09354.1 hypothetical protein AhaeAN59_04140 [Acinetobacter haemolyticus]QHI12617.1 hypothetical protein AhaeAN43_04095 [Acinetobacter haemolyticus]